MVKLARMAGLVAALCLVSAAPAHAAFVPELTVELSPQTAGSSPALTATISQPATDTAIERFTLTLPAGFQMAQAPGASVCAMSALRSGACPAATQVGAFAARLGQTVPLTGSIHKTGAQTFGLYISVLGGAIDQAVEGSLTKRANGSVDLKLDQLPALPLTILAMRFWGGGHSFVRTPARCGSYALDGKFTSRLGEFALDRTLMTVRGCTGAPLVTVADIRMSETRFRAGGSLYGTRTIIAWWASSAVDHTKVRIERRVQGAWRSLGVLVGTAHPGDNVLRWDGRLKGRLLKPGEYGLRIQPAGTDPAKRVRFRIVR